MNFAVVGKTGSAKTAIALGIGIFFRVVEGQSARVLDQSDIESRFREQMAETKGDMTKHQIIIYDTTKIDNRLFDFVVRARNL